MLLPQRARPSMSMSHDWIRFNAHLRL
jgi:hypothetical protein